jgi:uncharacterized membrane protein YjgN (DUF898 family)
VSEQPPFAQSPYSAQLPAIPGQQLPVPAYGYAPRQAGAETVRGGRQFAFDGGAATYFGTAILAVLITVCTLGFCYPFAVVLNQRWRAKHSYIDGHQLSFTGSAWALLGNWIKWFLLCIITAGIYSFWVGPRIARWKWENIGFAAPVHAIRHG